MNSDFVFNMFGGVLVSQGSVFEIEKRGSLAVLIIINPPLNVLSIERGVVSALTNAVIDLGRDALTDAIAIQGSGRDFSAGADLYDFEAFPDKVDLLRDLFREVAACPKPVTAILHGNVLGAGLELALAAHWRVAINGAKLGLPEVKLGLLPGGGGTQRLPRLVGVSRALDMMLSAETICADEALEIGLIDGLSDREVALQWAADRSGVGRRDERRRAEPDMVAIESHRAVTSRQAALGSARADIVDCVEAAVNFDIGDGLSFERERFNQLLTSAPSKALRHAFFAERKTGRSGPQRAKIESESISEVAVIGAGTMGTGIALSLLNASMPVTLVDTSDGTLENAKARIQKTFSRDVEKGRLPAAVAEARAALLTLSTDFGAVANADLVIEAVFEDIDVKRKVFERLDQLARPGAILATNTSTLDVDKIAAVTEAPDRVVGLHFFSPANIMRLVEVVRGAMTSEATLETISATVRKIGKVAVVVGNCDGFIGNRIFEEYLRQAYWLLEEGALPAQIDGALERWGMAMGPLKTMDLAGQDIGWSIRKRRAIAHPDRPYSRIPDLICEMGRFGQKTGSGYYHYKDGRTAEPDALIDDLIVQFSIDAGIERRLLSDEEIVERCIYAMINEGAKIVEEKIADRPLDIDVIYLNGYGFPRERGGPMFYADRTGLPAILNRMSEFASDREGWAWSPSSLLTQLATSGGLFAGLNS